ncbi:unnamed protein product [Hymenolepis diminuta]|uniref:EGF-like domain-containing protein n=1 Tax=Hymenolepis diminuta TaxID=6216 RepID=A0A564YFY7_HYMDI|nr:unnamed protein product [Hymenolepis diminuta]
MTNLYIIFLCLICLVHADRNSNVTLPSGPGGILYLSFVFTTVDGALAGGHDCDVFDTCDLFFKICVKSVNSRDCDLYTVTTSAIQNVASVTYEGDSAFQFSFRPPTNRIQVAIEAWDYDAFSNSDYIGRVQGTVFIQNITSLNTSIKLERGKTLYMNDFKIEASMRKECNPDYFGQICQYRINESSSNAIINQKMMELPAETTETTTPVPETNSRCTRAREIIGSEVCLNQGICLDDPDGTSYACYCSPGYKGARCELLDFCSNITCNGHGKCENALGTTGTFVCRCNPGWRGVLCDVPEQSACEVAFLSLPKDQLSICLHGGICVENLNGSGFQCQCVNGWIGERCETHVTQLQNKKESKDVHC